MITRGMIKNGFKNGTISIEEKYVDLMNWQKIDWPKIF